MTWLRRLLDRWHNRDAPITAMSLQVYKRPNGVALVIACEQGEVLMMMSRTQTLALCDLLMDTIEEAGPPAPGLQ